MFDRFAWPWLLALAAAVPVVLVIALLRSRRGRLLYPASDLAHGLGMSLRARLFRVPLLLRGLALVLLVVALARPQDTKGHVKTSTEGIAMQIVVDRSSSMTEGILLDGEKTSRLDAVKEMAREFIAGNGKDLKGRPGDMIGVIAFGSFADTVCPLVREHDALLDLISNVQVSPLRADQGTAIGDAIALAAARLRDAEKEVARGVDDDKGGDPGFKIKSKAIVLLTDGRNNRGDIAPMDAAAICKQWGIKLYTIGIGGNSTVKISGLTIPQGPNVDVGTMKAMAEGTGGKFFLADTADDLRDVYAEIDSLEKTKVETSQSVNYDERFPPFAAAALALLAIETLASTTVLRRTP